jgi:hypothetical protein
MKNTDLPIEELQRLAAKGKLLAARLHEAVLAMRADVEQKLTRDELKALVDNPSDEEAK